MGVGDQMARFATWIRAFLQDRTAATAVEYGIMVALIAVVIIITVALMGQALNDAFSSVQICVSSAWDNNAVCGS